VQATDVGRFDLGQRGYRRIQRARMDKYAQGVIPPPPPAPEPVRGSGVSRRLRTTIIAIVVIAIVVSGIIGYAVTGLAYAQTRVGNADRTLSTVISHQNSLNTTFKGIDVSATGLNSTNFDPKKASTLLDQFVANAKLAGTTINKDDATLASARAGLDEQQWLTTIARGSLDSEAARIDHARKALSMAKVIAADYAQVGGFWQALIGAFSDGQTVGNQIAMADLAGAQATLTTTKADTDKALQLSGAPGLPPELHALMVDFESLVADVGKLLAVVATGDDNAIVSTENQLQADATKVDGYDFAKIEAEIKSYYQPLVDSFNAEMARATA
jgi:hypothetical protein